MTKKRNKYDLFIRSTYWQNLRKKVLERDKYMCQICGSNEELQVHHTEYNYKNDKEHLDKLITLCQNCHVFIHKMQEKYKLSMKIK